MNGLDKNSAINQALIALRGSSLSDLSKLRALETLFDSAFALGRKEREEVYVLLYDSDRTLRSSPEPFGVAIRNEQEAKDYVASCNEGEKFGPAAYSKLVLYNTFEEYKNSKT